MLLKPANLHFLSPILLFIPHHCSGHQQCEKNYYSKKYIHLTIRVAKYLNFYFPWNHCASQSSPTIARVISSALHSRDWGAFSDWFPLCFLHREIDFCYVHNPNYYLSINPYYIKLYYIWESQSDEIFWEKGFLTFS